jgi:peptidase E
MKTKYILHGGDAQIINSDNDPFYAEILKDTPQNLKILFVYFGNDPERNEERKSGNIEQFNRVKEEKNIHYEIADEHNFIYQIEKSDIIYIRGGSTARLMATLSKFNNLREIFDGKIVSGESAGMNSISTYCFSKSGGIMKGLGILPIKTIPHYHGDAVGVKELEKIAPDLESLYLPEFEFKVFYEDLS